MDEAVAIESIYCGEGEFQLVQKGNDNCTAIFRLKLDCDVSNNRKCTIQVTFTLPLEYPQKPPLISLTSSSITRDRCDRFKEAIGDYITTLLGEPMLLDTITWIKDNVEHYISTPANAVARAGDVHTSIYQTAVLHLNHMRSKPKYCKTILKWTNELCLKGRLIFCDWLILILLQGSQESMKEYITRQRTVNVDIDSKGRACKERMMTILKIKDADQPKFTNFQLVEYEEIQLLKDMFVRYDLESLYEEYVEPLIHRQ